MNLETSGDQGSGGVSNQSPMPEQPVRIKLVNTAAEFLVSPTVQNSSMDMKLAFLKKKGLTEAEIDLAVKQSDARLMATRENEVRGGGGGTGFDRMQISPAPLYLPHPVSRWTLFRDIANSAILLAGLCYGAYWTYQNVVIPYLFGKKDRKSIDSRLAELDKTVTTCLVDISSNLSRLRDEMDKTSDRRADNILKDITELKSEVTSLKKLLLNRKQFPSASGVTPLSIPSWQITENDEKQSQTAEEEGHNSNGSESSLEMIKE